MKNTVKQYLSGVLDESSRGAVTKVLRSVASALSTTVLRAAGLEIAGTATLAQIGSGSTFVGTVNGKLVTIAAGTDMPALSGTVTADMFNVYCFFTTADGTRSSVMGTEASSLLGVRFPDFAEDKLCIGFVIVNPTGTGNFVGGTTGLADGTVAPNAVYVSPTGAFDPTFIF